MVGLPILNDFRINDPVQAEKILADGQCDMVGMVRAFIADPELPNKARHGRLDDQRAYGREAVDALVSSIGRYAAPEEMAEPLVFLNSNMARYISGHDLQVDYGFVASVMTGKKKFGP